MIRTLMLTGDAKETAIAIARQIRLLPSQSQGRGVSVSGAEIDRMADPDLQTVVKTASVFYRVTPRHKVRIVKALQVQSNQEKMFPYIFKN